MATSSLKKGWLTSLAPSRVRAKAKSRFLNAKPVTYLSIPQISFARKASSSISTAANDNCATVEDQQSVVLFSAANFIKDGTTHLSELSKDVGALTLKSSSAGVSNKSRLDQTPAQSTSSSTQVQDADSTILTSPQQTQHGPIQFHRRTHQKLHCHNILSNPSPLTSDRRKYLIPTPHLQPPHPLTINTDPRSHIRPSTPEPISPTTLHKHLQKMIHDELWVSDCQKRESQNPFPGIDQNHGWNRAFSNGLLYFSDWTPFNPDWTRTLRGALEEQTYARRSLARFSLWAQREAMEFDEADVTGEKGWGKVFDKVFKGEALGMCWARRPGGWHAVRSGLLTCCRSVSFVDEVADWTEGIWERVKAWRRANDGWRARQDWSRKLKFSKLWPGVQDHGRFQRDWLGGKEVGCDGDESGVKRRRLHGPEPEKIATELWRARRREQEKKAGRWEDGTIRQNRMWAEFHWVLNVDDPRENIWPYKRYFCKEGVWYWCWACVDGV